MCCTVDSCVDVINISPGTLTQTRACEEYRDFVILILHQQWDEAYCLHSLWLLLRILRVNQLTKRKSYFPAFPFKLCCVMKVTLFSINVMLLWLLGWAASQARAVSDHGGITSDAWSQWSDSLNPRWRRPWVLFSGVASVLCPVRKHKLVSSLVKCLHFSIIIHRSVFSPRHKCFMRQESSSCIWRTFFLLSVCLILRFGVFNALSGDNMVRKRH